MRHIEIVSSQAYSIEEFFNLMKINPIFREGNISVVYEPKFINSQSTISGLLLKNYYQRLSKTVPLRVKKNPLTDIVRIHSMMSNFKQRCGINRCEYCYAYLEFNEKTVDHFIPLCKGGLNDIDNLRISCFNCNQSKGELHPVKQMQKWEIFLAWSRSGKNQNFSNYFNSLPKKKYPKIYLKKY